MKNWLPILFILVLLLPACQHSRGKATVTETPEKKALVNISELNGYWIMSEYIDDILKTKSIGKHLRKRMTWLAVVLQIENDSLQFFGTIPVHNGNMVKLTSYQDSLTTLKWMGNYQLSYDIMTDKIKGFGDEAWGEKVDNLTYNFRRVKESEMRIVKDILGKPTHKGLRPNMYSLFLDSLMVVATQQLVTTVFKIKAKQVSIVVDRVHHVALVVAM